MAEKLAILGGKPAITLDHKDFSVWPIYTEEEVEVVSKLIREDKLSSAHRQRRQLRNSFPPAACGFSACVLKCFPDLTRTCIWFLGWMCQF